MPTPPPKFSILGRIVTHHPAPQFSVRFIRADGGGWESDQVRFIGEVPTDPKLLARLMREAGDYFAAHRLDDWIQQRCIARASELGLTAYAIAKATGGAVSEDHVQDFLTASASMGSSKLQHVLKVLGLDLSPQSPSDS